MWVRKSIVAAVVLSCLYLFSACSNIEDGSVVKPENTGGQTVEEPDGQTSKTRIRTPAEDIVSVYVVARNGKDRRQLEGHELARAVEVLAQMDAVCALDSEDGFEDGVLGLKYPLFIVVLDDGCEVVVGTDGLYGWFDDHPYAGDYDTSQALIELYDELV